MGYSEDDVLNGGRPKAVKWDRIGDSIRGVVETSEVGQVTDTKGALQWWDEAKTRPKLQSIIVLRTTKRERPDDDGRRTVYVKSHMLTAMNEAIKASGWKRPTFDVPTGKLTGCELAFRYKADGTPPGRGMSAPKLFDCKFTPPPEDFRYPGVDYGFEENYGEDEDEDEDEGNEPAPRQRTQGAASSPGTGRRQQERPRQQAEPPPDDIPPADDDDIPF